MLINGERALAYVARIEEIKSIPNADKIEVARVGGWQVVVKKDEFKAGDLAVYIEIDSRVPSDNPEFAFLQDRKYKVKSIKLRGQISQGLIVPMSALPEGEYEEGTDVTGILGIKKIKEEKPVISRSREDRLKNAHPSLTKKLWFKKMMKYSWFRKLAFKFLIPKKKKSGWPAWIQKSDSERIQNMTWILKDKETGFYVSEKLDGSSFTADVSKGSFGKLKFMVCSRNVVQDTPDKKSYLNDVNGIEGNAYWEMAIKYNIESKMKEMFKELGCKEHLTIQGELCGEGIQKNKYNIKGRELYIFNVYVDTEYLEPRKMRAIMEKYNIPIVPFVDYDYHLPDTFEELMEYSTGKSQKADTLREGYVFKSHDGKINFKCVSNEFLLKWKL